MPMKRILFVGDIVGKPGRQSLREVLPALKSELSPDVVIVNGENAAGGAGISENKYIEIIGLGVDAMTLGNHVWHNRDFVKEIDRCTKAVRPANYPAGAPGLQKLVVNGVGIINLCGRVFMHEMDCPFRRADELISELRKETNIILVDFHAEASSEKAALGWYLDGRASAVLGTHTHVQTADEKILPKGTAFISDVGMVGALNSIIGVEISPIIEKFITQIPKRFEVEKKPPYILNAVCVDIDEATGKAAAISRVNKLIQKPLA